MCILLFARITGTRLCTCCNVIPSPADRKVKHSVTSNPSLKSHKPHFLCWYYHINHTKLTLITQDHSVKYRLRRAEKKCRNKSDKTCDYRRYALPTLGLDSFPSERETRVQILWSFCSGIPNLREAAIRSKFLSWVWGVRLAKQISFLQGRFSLTSPMNRVEWPYWGSWSWAGLRRTKGWHAIFHVH